MRKTFIKSNLLSQFIFRPILTNVAIIFSHSIFKLIGTDFMKGADIFNEIYILTYKSLFWRSYAAS